MTKIAFIARNPINSPNMTANDAAIIESIMAELAGHGVKAILIGEEEEIPDDTQIVCTMSRTASTIERLKKAEKQGVIVLNSTAAVENCSRKAYIIFVAAPTLSFLYPTGE